MPTADQVGMHIVEVLYSFHHGGSERLGSLLAREFRARGHDVTAVAMFEPGGGPVGDELESIGVRCVEVGLLGVRRMRRWRVMNRFRGAIAEVGRPVVHFHHAGALIAGIGAIRAASTSAVVMTEHTDAALRASFPLRLRTRLALHSCDHVTTVGDHISRYFVEHLGAPGTRVSTVPNPVHPRFMSASRSQDAVSRRAGIEYLFVGRLVPEKGLEHLVDAVELVRDRLPAMLRIAIVGDGPERTTLEQRVRAAGLQHIFEFRGASADPLSHYRAADAFVLPSMSEGAPLALLEAMACGLPCVATRVGSVPSILRGDAGVLVEPGTPSSLGEALVLVAESETLRSTLGKAARRRVEEEHRLETVVDGYLDVFSRARAGRASAPRRGWA